MKVNRKVKGLTTWQGAKETWNELAQKHKSQSKRMVSNNGRRKSMGYGIILYNI